MNRSPQERDERLKARIEAFSDLVMGFSLALLGLTLVIPQHAAALFFHPWWLVCYFWTFAVIAILWFNHQRLFSLFFLVHPVCLVLNFVFLSMIGLLVYFLQVFGHVRGEADQAIALLAYFGALGTSLLTIGILYAIGTRVRWHQLTREERYLGVRAALRGIVVGVFLDGGVIITPLFFLELHLRATLTLAYSAIFAVIVTRIALQFLRPRIVGTSAHASA